MFDNGSLLRRRKRFKTLANGLLKRKLDSNGTVDESEPTDANNTNNSAYDEFDYDEDNDDDADEDDDEDNEEYANQDNNNNQNENENDSTSKVMHSPAAGLTRFMPILNNDILKKQIDQHNYLQYFQNQYLNPIIQHQHQQQHQQSSSDTSLSSTSSLVVSLPSNKTVNDNNNISPLSSSSSSSSSILSSTPNSSNKSLQFSSSSPNEEHSSRQIECNQAKKLKVSSSFSIDSLIGNNSSSNINKNNTDLKEKSLLNKLNSHSLAIKHKSSTKLKLSKPNKTVPYQEMFNEHQQHQFNQIAKQQQQQQYITSHLFTNNNLATSTTTTNSRGTSISSNNSRLESRSSNSSGSRCASPSNTTTNATSSTNLTVEVENNSNNNRETTQKNYHITQANMMNSFLSTNKNQTDVTNRLINSLAYLPNGNLMSNNMLIADQMMSMEKKTELMLNFAQQSLNNNKSLNQPSNIYKILNDTILMRAAVAAAAASQSAQMNFMLYNQNINNNNNSNTVNGHSNQVQVSQQNRESSSSSSSSSSSNSNQADVNVSNILPLFMPMRT
jgi:hypothetical protein